MKKLSHLLTAVAVCCLGYSGFAQPANDLCGGATALTPGTVVNPGFTTSSNVGATTTAATDIQTCWIDSQPGVFVNNTVWFSFTTGAAGSYTITTDVSDGSSPDTQMELFSGTCGALSSIDCSEDDGSCNTLAAEITANLAAATTYYVMVDIYGNTTGSFQIAVIENNSTTTYAYDCIGGAIDLTTIIQPGLVGAPTHGCTGTYEYHNVTKETITVGGLPYNACNNNPPIDTFFGVWFKFKYDATKPNAWLSVHPVATPQCDGGESENIFYTAHLFKAANITGSGCSLGKFNSVGALTAKGWCSVGDGDWSENGPEGARDKAGDCFYDHPRIDIGGNGELTHDSTYYIMVAQMTRISITVVIGSDTIFDPLGNPIAIVPVFDTVHTAASPDNGLFYLTYEEASNAQDICPGTALVEDVPLNSDNAGTKGNIQTSVYGGSAPVPNEPNGYVGNNSGRGPLENCDPNGAVIVGASLQWENHNSAIYQFTIDDSTLVDTVCLSTSDLETDLLALIDALCPLLEIYPGNFPVIFSPTGDTLLNLGPILVGQFGDTIRIPDEATCDEIKMLISLLLGNIPDTTVCFAINCTPQTSVSFTNNSGCCGEGSPLLVVKQGDCVNGPVAMWSEIDCAASSCIILSSGLNPLNPGTYYVVVEGDGAVLDYTLKVSHEYNFGAGGAPCGPDALAARPEDGKRVAGTTGIADNLGDLTHIRLQPVPASSELTLKFNANSTGDNVRVSVTDMTGKVVIAAQQVEVSKGANSYSLDISELSNGLYLLNLDNNGERVATRFNVIK